MKKYLYIGVLDCILACMVGCSHTEDVWSTKLPSEGYIYFNTEVDSRGTLVTSMQNEDFGVVGFCYTGDWNTVKVQAVPNVFENHGQEVTWETDDKGNGYHSYTPYAEWDATKKYTFFGYYPFGMQLSDKDTEGVPYIDYTLPESVSDMKDVMTASLYDTDNSASNAVGLTFKHRLVAMDVQARNFHEEGIRVKVKSLAVSFDNLLYNQVRVPLDASLDITSGVVNGWNKKPNYSIVSSSVIVEPTGSSSAAVSLLDNSSLIFIPQDKDNNGHYLKGSVKLDYSFVDENDNLITVTNSQGQSITGEDNVNLSFETGKSMLAGRRYYLLLNFSKTSVSIAIVDSGEWTDEKVEIEFE